MKYGMLYDPQGQKFIEILADLETTKKCSGGICNSNDTSQHLPIYMFSNVNDGIPETSCHESLKDLMMKEVNMYLISFALALSFTVIVVFVYFIILLHRIHSYCKKR